MLFYKWIKIKAQKGTQVQGWEQDTNSLSHEARPCFLPQQGSTQAWQGTTLLPLTTNHGSFGRHWLDYQTAGQLLSCRDGSSPSPAVLTSCRHSPRDLWGITGLRYEFDFTRGKHPTYLCTHRGKAVVSMATLILRAFNSSTSLLSALYPRASLPLLISMLTEGVLGHAQLSAFLLPAGFPCVPGRAERPLGTCVNFPDTMNN